MSNDSEIAVLLVSQ